MTKDYAKKRSKNKSFQRGKASQAGSAPFIPGWVWLFAGVFMGVGLAIFILWKWGQFFDHPPKQPPIIVTEKDAAPVENKNIASNESKPRFDFYTLLPNLKVDVPDIATPPAVKPPQVAEDEPRGSSLAFIIQAGSFKTEDQADKLKATLALHGFESQVQTVTIPPDETWYRVYIGPFKNKKEAFDTHQNLEQTHAANSLILKIRV